MDNLEHRPSKRTRTRAAIACAVCRSRKTKCDGCRPVCGYCQRTNSVCQYDNADAGATDSALSHDIGSQILQAIKQLTRLVESQPHQPTTPPQPQEPRETTTLSYHPRRFSGLPSSSHLSAFSEGLESIFSWRVFPPGIKAIRIDDGRPAPMPDELPPVTFSELNRLQVEYRRVVHSMNPILDLETLDQYIIHVSENGIDWTTRTCLVALVCAIGALCQESIVETPSSLPLSDRGADVDIAYRFWSVASKRLGRAMSQNTLESAQCLCLAGIWYMCNLQPLDAWKHFTMAGNCCYATSLSKKPEIALQPQTLHPTPQVIEQSTFYTAYKSEVEIRYELAIPGSVLEHIDDRLVFPSPPTLKEVQEGSPTDETITWYYYLTDIAARHLINRIINLGVKVVNCPNEVQVKALLHDYKIFGSQLEEWYESLPPEISFEPPNSNITPELHPFKRIVRSRYLFIRELLCRPFLRICLNYALNLPEAMLDEIASIGSLDLQYCVWRLQAAGKVPRLDHGLWIWIRNHTACAMILIGAARSNKFFSLNVAPRLQMPDSWRDVTVGFLENLEVLSTETRGGVKDCYDLIYSGLRDFQNEDHLLSV